MEQKVRRLWTKLQRNLYLVHLSGMMIFLKIFSENKSLSKTSYAASKMTTSLNCFKSDGMICILNVKIVLRI